MSAIADFTAATDDDGLRPLTLADLGALERWMLSPIGSPAAAEMLCSDEGVRRLLERSAKDECASRFTRALKCPCRAALAAALVRVNGVPLAAGRVVSDVDDGRWLGELARKLHWSPTQVAALTPRQLLLCLGFSGTVVCENVQQARAVIEALPRRTTQTSRDPMRQFIGGLQAMLGQLQFASTRTSDQVERSHESHDVAAALWRLEQTMTAALHERWAVFAE